MTGISEILVLLLLIACILILPRMMKGVPAKRSNTSAPMIRKLGPAVRLGIVASILYPVVLLLYLKPWSTGAYLSVISIGLLPVLVIWSLAWVLAGRKR